MAIKSILKFLTKLFRIKKQVHVWEGEVILTNIEKEIEEKFPQIKNFIKNEKVNDPSVSVGKNSTSSFNSSFGTDLRWDDKINPYRKKEIISLLKKSIMSFIASSIAKEKHKCYNTIVWRALPMYFIGGIDGKEIGAELVYCFTSLLLTQL